MNNEDLWKLLNTETLGTLPPRGTLRTGGLFLSVQYFFLREELEALRESNLTCSGRDRKGKVPERVEGHGAVTAGRTFQRALQLTHE